MITASGKTLNKSSIPDNLAAYPLDNILFSARDAAVAVITYDRPSARLVAAGQVAPQTTR